MLCLTGDVACRPGNDEQAFLWNGLPGFEQRFHALEIDTHLLPRFRFTHSGEQNTRHACF